MGFYVFWMCSCYRGSFLLCSLYSTLSTNWRVILSSGKLSTFNSKELELRGLLHLKMDSYLSKNNILAELFFTFFIRILFYAVCVCMLMCVFVFCVFMCVCKRKRNRYHLIALSLRQIHGLNLLLLFYWLVWKTTGPCDPAIFASLGTKMIGIPRSTLFFTWPTGFELKFLAFQTKRFCL